MKHNKRLFITILILAILLIVGGTMLFKSTYTVGKDINSEDISEFYYTISSSTNPPEFQRYYLYAKDGKHYFVHEKREGDHWPLTEEDVTVCGEVELSESEWNEFFKTLIDGKVTKRKESALSGGKGPFLYIYWNKDKGSYQVYDFATEEKQLSFEKLCLKYKGY